MPKKLKLWNDSHESGLYGFLGRVIPEDKAQEQTLIVEKGGKFQMNYDAKNKKFTQGSSINGQLVLKDGAVINSSSIYSNANSVTDSNVARRIDWPVVKVEGKVTVE